jgi:hypothetical protein
VWNPSIVALAFEKLGQVLAEIPEVEQSISALRPRATTIYRDAGFLKLPVYGSTSSITVPSLVPIFDNSHKSKGLRRIHSRNHLKFPCVEAR